jgi:hypothetical protein
VLPLTIVNIIGPGGLHTKMNIFIWPLSLNVLLYLFYFCGTNDTQTKAYLSNIVSYSVIDNYIQRMKRTNPTFWMHVRCWHVHRRMSGGKKKGIHAIDTYKKKEVYDYDVCTDVTPFSGLSMGNFPLVVVDSVVVTTMSSASQRKFDEQYESLRARNCNRDKNTTMTQGAELDDLVEHYLVKAPGEQLSVFLSSEAYFWACLFMLYIPYQIWFQSQTGAAKLTFCKDITSHAEQAEATEEAMIDPNDRREATLASGGETNNNKQALRLVDHMRGLQLQLQQGLISDAEFNQLRIAAIGTAVSASHEAMPLRRAASSGSFVPSAAGSYGGQMSRRFVERSSSLPEVSGRSIYDELQHLEDLRNNGTITQAMLDSERAMLLAEIPAADGGLGV